MAHFLIPHGSYMLRNFFDLARTC